MPRLKLCLQKDRLECGLDEAGRGALAGPVVAAAVILPPGFRGNGITDSKQLSAADRHRLRDYILKHALAWNVGMGSVALVDTINILQASLTAMHEAVDGLLMEPEHLLVDGNRFRKHAIAHTCIIEGDAHYLSIAAASILAKTYRDDIMRGLHPQFPQYNWGQNMGYPTVQHRQAILDHGLSPWHRRTFQVKAPQPVLFDISAVGTNIPA